MEAQVLEKTVEEAQRQYAERNNGETREFYGEPFDVQVRALINGQMSGDGMLLLGRTPKILRDIGLSDLPIMMDQNHARKLREGTTSSTNDDHILSWKTIRELPQLIADPVAVILSPKEEYRDKTVNVIISAENKNGKQVHAAIALDTTANINGSKVDINKAATVFGTVRIVQMFNSAVMKTSLGAKEVLYINKKKATSLYRGSSNQMAGETIGDGLINNITDAASPVKSQMKKQTETRQFKRWFGNSKVVNADGSPKIMYHGTPNGTFSVFKGWQYFTENKAYADVYQNQGASSNGYKRTADNPVTYEVYLKAEKPFDTRNEKERNIFMKEFFMKWGNGTPLSERGLPDWTDGDDIIEFLDENGYDYDSIVLDEGGTGGYGDEVKDRGVSWVIRDSAQIKSATDNVGTFDPDNPDIRYSERRHRTPTIRQAVSRMKVDERMNETEKLLLGRYKADAVRKCSQFIYN